MIGDSKEGLEKVQSRPQASRHGAMPRVLAGRSQKEKMIFKELIKREAYVVMHGQTIEFRIAKYLVLLLLSLGVYFWKGIGAVGAMFAVLIVLGLVVHFIFRLATQGWTKSRWFYTRIPFEDR